jgi:GntR family transcriptional repressor for pyruvate dehydrogenase complex
MGFKSPGSPPAFGQPEMLARKMIQSVGIVEESDPSGDGFVPLQRSARLADQLYEQIVNQIVQGSLPTGERLPSENRLCAIFNVSRPVVREAICRLQADGLVVTKQGAGTFVAIRPKDELLNLAPIGGMADLMRCFEFRIALEGEAAFLAAQRRTRESMTEIDKALAALSRAIRHKELGAEADHRFHVVIARASQNELFHRSLETLSAHIRASVTVGRSLSLNHSTARLEAVQSEHEAIGKVIRTGDAECARNYMRTHIDNARARVLGDATKG